MTVFNARKTEYKDKIRAIATDEAVRLRIVVPRNISCSAATLCITKEGEETACYAMFWAGMCGEEHEYWELHFSATTAGLYWYHFELETPWGKSFVKNTGSGIGDFAYDGAEFQQTVYDKAFTTPNWLKGGLIYQIFPDRFYNSGTEKTGVRPTRVMRPWGAEPYWYEEQMGGIWNNDYFGGDLKGIEEKLSYLASLGVTCLYLNPIFEANSNHRYDTADYEKVDPLLGTEEDLRSLCAKAREHGVSVLLDGVFSHTGCDSKYFNMYGNYKAVGAYNSPDSPYYSWYKFEEYPDKYKSWWGIKLLPELIEENEDYRTYICGENGIVRRWLRCGARGWRLDVADELPDVFLDDLRRAVKTEKPDALILGEVWENVSTKFSYGARRRYLLGEQLDSVMNYPFADAVLNFVKFHHAEGFFDAILSVTETYPPQVTNVLMNHIGTHDTERAITRLAGEDPEGHGRAWQHERNTLSDRDYRRGVRLLRLASLLQYTLPGVPSLYYGDERGMQGMKDPFNRACMDWTNPDEELLHWYKRLGEIRKGCPAFKDGELIPLYAQNGTVVYTRTAAHSEVLVAVNAGDEVTDISLPDAWNACYTLLGEAPVYGTLRLEPLTYALLTRER